MTHYPCGLYHSNERNGFEDLRWGFSSLKDLHETRDYLLDLL